jgi:nicotinate-nucleotide adenylyltransferase
MKKKQRIGIYGGTYNPPHIGHLNAANFFLTELNLDRVIIIPAGQPPHKTVSEGVDASVRFEMAKAAFAPMGDRFEVSDFEIERGGPNYTSDTLAHFKSDENDLFLLCGTDMFLTLEKWHCFEDVFALSTVVCMPREHEFDDVIAKKKREYEKLYKAKCIILKGQRVELSSTTVRELAKRGEDYSGLVPEGVADVIRREKLYV